MEIKVSPNSRGQRGLSTRKVIAPWCWLPWLRSMRSACSLKSVPPDFWKRFSLTFMSKGAITRSRLWIPTNARRFSHMGEASSSSLFWKGARPPKSSTAWIRDATSLDSGCLLRVPLVPGRRGIPIQRSGEAPWPTVRTSCQPSLDMVRNRACAMENLLPGKGHSSPIVWGDQVLVSMAIPTGPKRLLSTTRLRTRQLACRSGPCLRLGQLQSTDRKTGVENHPGHRFSS